MDQANGGVCIARVTRGWYIVCRSGELRRKPLARTLLGMPLVLFRGEEGRAGALLDRCAHRNVPLSLGRVCGDVIECRYHGWQYGTSGRCLRVPGLLSDSSDRAERRVPGFPVREQDGFVWVYGTADVEPDSEPYRLPALEGTTTVRRVLEAPGTLHAVIENALDVPHTAFLHRGLFRGTGVVNRITAVVTRTANSVQAEYIGEPRPAGLAGWILSPQGGAVLHTDRFILPSIAQVEYRLGKENHILITSFCTPVEDFRTVLYAVISFRLRLPGWLVKLFLQPVADRIFRQDARILREQTEAVRRFEGEHYASTEIDVLGFQIRRLLRRAERGQLLEDDETEWRREIELEA